MKNIILLSLLFIMSCSTQKMNSNIPFEIIAQSEYGTDQPKQQLLITSEDEFETYYQLMYQNQSPSPKTPKIDFDSKDVIFLHFGTYNYGGNKFDLTQIEWRNQDLVIHITQPVRDKNEMVTTVITNPFIFVAIDKLQDQPENIIIEK